MDTYILRDLDGATVGFLQDFPNFKDVIDWIFATHPYKRALDMLGLDDCEDLSEALVDDHGQFSEDRAMQLCMENLDGVNADEDDPEAEAGDEKYARAAGK